MYGPLAGAAVGGALGQYKRENPGDPNQGMAMALRGGAAGVASNIAGGQNMFTGRGLSKTYGYSPLDIGRGVLEEPMKYLKADEGKGNFKFMDRYFPGKDVKEKALKDAIDQKVKEGYTRDKAYDIVTKGGIGPAGMTMKEALGYGIPASIAFAQLIKAGQPKGDDTPIKENRTIYDQIFDPTEPVTFVAKGGVMDLQDGGESKGPGTGTSDSIPAMLSDGEFVMTAKAVRGAGGGDRREGARKMYETMDRLEARA